MADQNVNPEADPAANHKAAREDLVARLSDRGRGRGVDFGERDLGWTAQMGAAPARDLEVPGQVIVPEQLPDPEVQRAAGIDPEQHKAGLVIADYSEAKTLPGGPEPLEALRLGLTGDFKKKMPDALVAEAEEQRAEDNKTDVQKAVEQNQADAQQN